MTAPKIGAISGNTKAAQASDALADPRGQTGSAPTLAPPTFVGKGKLMKWIKHLTVAWDDEKLANLVGAGGDTGLAMYGLYWRVQEIIAAHMEGNNPSCSVSYSVSRWSQLLVTRGSLVFSKLSRLAVTGVVTVERHGDDIRVTNRNLLKYRDEYSRKSGQTQDNVAQETELDKETDTEEELDKESTFAESLKKPSAETPPIGTLPCVGKHQGKPAKSWSLYQAKVDEWQGTYPGISVVDELRKARQWLIDNPTQKKTHGGMTRFLNSWLSKAQNGNHHGGNGNGNGISKSQRNQQLTIDGLKRSYEELGINPHSLSKDRAELLGNGKPGAPTLNGNVRLRPADPTDPGSHRSVVERH